MDLGKITKELNEASQRTRSCCEPDGRIYHFRFEGRDYCMNNAYCPLQERGDPQRIPFCTHVEYHMELAE